jgi:hypothetical protein
MNKKMFSFIKILCGIYLAAFLIWLLYLKLFTETNSRGFVLLLLFLIVGEIGTFFYGVVFYFLTKNFSDLKQINYGLCTYIIYLYIYLLVIDFNLFRNPYTILVLLINLFSLVFIFSPTLRRMLIKK